MKRELITASEIGDYVYCKRGWQLRQQGLLESNPQMLQGITDHNKLFTRVSWQRPLLRIAFFLLILGIIGFVLLLLFQLYLL